MICIYVAIGQKVSQVALLFGAAMAAVGPAAVSRP